MTHFVVMVMGLGRGARRVNHGLVKHLKHQKGALVFVHLQGYDQSSKYAALVCTNFERKQLFLVPSTVKGIKNNGYGKLDFFLFFARSLLT